MSVGNVNPAFKRAKTSVAFFIFQPLFCATGDFFSFARDNHPVPAPQIL